MKTARVMKMPLLHENTPFLLQPKAALHVDKRNTLLLKYTTFFHIQNMHYFNFDWYFIEYG